MRLVAVLLASAIVVAAASAGPNAARPSALLTYTASPRSDPEQVSRRPLDRLVSDVLEPTLVPSDGSQPPAVIPVADFAGDIDWFPGGKRLAISKFFDDDIGVYGVNLDGSGLKLLARGSEPAVSPNGRKLAFVRIVGRSRFVFVANADGSKPRRLTKGTKPEANPAWSPEGKWIAFERTIDPQAFFPHNSVVVTRSDGTGSYVAVTARRYDPFYPAWRRGTSLPKATRSSC